MYQQYYGFKAKPFDELRDANQYFLGRSQRHVVTSVHNGLKMGRGIVAINASEGVGKSAFIKFFQKEQINSRFVIASISAEESDDLGLLYLILTGFKQDIIDYKTPNLVEQVETFVQYQIQQGNSPLLIIDDAHKLNDYNLEVLQRLTKFEKDGKLYFQVMLVGDEALEENLNSKVHQGLKNNVVSSGKMEPMQCDETKSYVFHRLRQVGWVDNPIVSDGAIIKAHEETGGVPAKINFYFDRFLHRVMINLPDPIAPEPKSTTAREYNAQNLLSVLIDLRDEQRESSNRTNSNRSPNKKTVNKAKFRNNPAKNASKLHKNNPARKNTWFNWHVAGVIAGSYLLSVVIAGTYYYFDETSNVNGNSVLIARK